jgi:phosphatidylglycerol---prolipoprotein diacylglyceryl transferase
MSLPLLIKIKSYFSSFSPAKLAVIIAVFGLIISIPLGVFFSQTFTRSWKVNQKIVLAEHVIINDLGFVKLSNICPTSTQTTEGNVVKECLEPLQVGEVSVRFYSLCILLAVLCGYAMALYLSRQNFVASTVIDRLVVGLVIFGIVGARLFFVAFNWSDFADKPMAIITEISQGGLAIFGAIVACSLYIFLYCRRYKFNFYEFLDFMAPSVLIGQIIGRFGNFFNYEGYGPETSVFWKMYVPESASFYGDIGAKYFHPTFLYEIIPNFFLLIILLWSYRDLTQKNSGLVFARYAMGYGVIRFFTEFFRVDSLKIYLPSFLQIDIPGYPPFTYFMASQLMSIALFCVGYGQWHKRQKVIYTKKDMTELYI